jgi:hypothetical protein
VIISGFALTRLSGVSVASHDRHMLGARASGKSMSVWGDCGEKVNIGKQASCVWVLIKFNHEAIGQLVSMKYSLQDFSNMGKTFSRFVNQFASETDDVHCLDTLHLLDSNY